MALPTRDELHDEVDRRFAEQFPDAPARLDNDDPGHAAWIEAWLGIRDEVLHDWVDEVFARWFPDAGRLDPDNPGDGQLIDYWTDIRDQIRDGVPGRWDWSGDPGGDRDALRAVSVDRDPAGGWVVGFGRPVTVEEAEAFLWADGRPDGVQVTQRSGDRVHLRGLSIEAVQRMHPDVAGRIDPTVITADPPRDPSDPPGGGGGPGGSGIEVEIDETTMAQIAEWTEHALHGGHAISATVEVVEYLSEATAHITGHASKAATLAKAAGRVSRVLGPVGYIFTVIWAGWAVIDAFRAERRRQHRRGFVYGVMWQALDEPDHIPEFDPGITYSAEELREAFEEGVAQGRAKARDTVLRNKIILAVATRGLTTELGDFYAANEIISELWRSSRERTPGDSDTDTIPWPVPNDYRLLGIP
jgi:hypothetical protein